MFGSSLKFIGDPDWRQAAAASWSFARGVPVGVGMKMQRTPAVFERKVTWRSLDDSEFDLDRGNYKSADQVIAELDKQFKQEELER